MELRREILHFLKHCVFYIRIVLQWLDFCKVENRLHHLIGYHRSSLSILHASWHSYFNDITGKFNEQEHVTFTVQQVIIRFQRVDDPTLPLFGCEVSHSLVDKPCTCICSCIIHIHQTSSEWCFLLKEKSPLYVGMRGWRPSGLPDLEAENV
jgi:hypothetical protein